MQTARIDKALIPVSTRHLVRLGEEFDGGYVVDKRSVEAADILISLGVGASWAFEADCLDIKPMPLEAYDGHVGFRRYLADLVRSMLPPAKPWMIRQRGRLLFDYLMFFRRDKRHNVVLVGRDSPPEEISFAQVLRAHAVGPRNRAFVKIDIEGSEYHLLETLIDSAPHITGLAIEFHNFGARLSLIKDFVDRFELHVAHTHVNNFEGIAPNGSPDVLEVSFTQSSPDTEVPPPLPGPLDRPNDPSSDDYGIAFV